MPGESRPSVIRRRMGSAKEQNLSKANNATKSRVVGIANDQSIEPIPAFIQSKSENVITNGQNAWIVLGRDRPGHLLTGKGGVGDTGAASIDMVVGRLSGNPVERTTEDEKIFVDPDFKKDAARIHISQKTDVDVNFGLEVHAKGSGNLSNRSAIGLKADGVRIIGREGVKIVAGGDAANSQNARITEIPGIDLIAYGQNELLEPLVKGGRLLQCLHDLSSEVDRLTAVVDGLLINQIKLNESYIQHTHLSPFYQLPTNPSLEAQYAGQIVMDNHVEYTEPDLQTIRKNLNNWRNKYIQALESEDYICSRHNKTT